MIARLTIALCLLLVTDAALAERKAVVRTADNIVENIIELPTGSTYQPEPGRRLDPDPSMRAWIGATSDGLGGYSAAPAQAPIPAPTRGSVPKDADQSVQSTTVMVSDAALRFPVEANKRYRVEGMIQFNTGATGDFKYQFSCPGTPTVMAIARLHLVPGTTAAVAGTITGCGPATTVVGTAAGQGWVWLNGVVEFPSAGNVVFMWGQNSSDATATILRAGSYVEFRAVQ